MTLKEYRLHYSDATHRAIAKGLKKGGGGGGGMFHKIY